MKRRRLLVAAAAVCAGCVGGEDSTTEPATEQETAAVTATSSPTSTPTPTIQVKPTAARPEQAEAAITDALTNLDTATDQLAEEARDIEFESARWSSNAITAALDKADENLTVAQGYATEDQDVLIEALFSYLTYTRTQVEMVASFAEAIRLYERAVTYERNNAYEQAADQLEQGSKIVAQTMTLRETAAEELRDVPERAFETGSVGYAESEDLLTYFERTLGPLEMTYGVAARIDHGLHDWIEAEDSWAREDYAIASSFYSKAQTHFEKARNDFEGSNDAVPNWLLDATLTLSCKAKQYAIATREMTKAAGVVETNLAMARDHIAEANRALRADCIR